MIQRRKINTTTNENHTKFASATGSGQQQGSTTTTSAGNPDSLKQDKADKSGNSISVQEATSGDNLTNYTNLPPQPHPHIRLTERFELHQQEQRPARPAVTPRPVGQHPGVGE